MDTTLLDASDYDQTAFDGRLRTGKGGKIIMGYPGRPGWQITLLHIKSKSVQFVTIKSSVKLQVFIVFYVTIQ